MKLQTRAKIIFLIYNMDVSSCDIDYFYQLQYVNSIQTFALFGKVTVV